MDSLSKLSLFILMAAHSISAVAQSNVNVSLELNAEAPQISKHIYGHFAEQPWNTKANRITLAAQSFTVIKFKLN